MNGKPYSVAVRNDNDDIERYFHGIAVTDIALPTIRYKPGTGLMPDERVIQEFKYGATSIFTNPI